jgi:hypothetical protein
MTLFSLSIPKTYCINDVEKIYLFQMKIAGFGEMCILCRKKYMFKDDLLLGNP